MTNDKLISRCVISGWLILMIGTGISMLAYKMYKINACRLGDLEICHTLSNEDLARALQQHKMQPRGIDPHRELMLRQLSD